MVSRSLGLALSLVALVGCGSTDPSTMARVPSNGPYPQAIDERTGVLAVMELTTGGAYETSLRRIDGAAYTTLTPPIPDDRSGNIQTVAWFEAGALAGDLDRHLFRFRGGAWDVVSMAACDPTLPSALLMDARGVDDAWVLATDFSSAATLCHFDGAGFDTNEALDFVPREVVAIDGAMIATDSTGRVMRRATGERAWSAVRDLFESQANLGALVVRSDAAYVGFAGGRWWRLTASTEEPVEAMPGMNGERWRMELTETTHHECHYSIWSDREICSDITDVAEYHVTRVDGATPVEAGYLRLQRPDVTWYVAMIVGPGQFVLAGSSGQIYVTVPAASAP